MDLLVPDLVGTGPLVRGGYFLFCPVNPQAEGKYEIVVRDAPPMVPGNSVNSNDRVQIPAVATHRIVFGRMKMVRIYQDGFETEV